MKTNDLFLMTDTELDLARLRFWTKVLNLGLGGDLAREAGSRAASDLMVDRARLERARA